MRITCLLENSTERSDMKTEHGLSLYIETASHRILFDMGQTAFFYENALTLGIDLSAVDLAVLSHGHYDHGGGLRKFLEVNPHAPVYVHRDAFRPHYNGTEKYIGLDPSLRDHPRLVLTDDEHPIHPSLLLCTCNAEKRTHLQIPSGLTEMVGDRFIPEDFRHEQYLLIQEKEKRVCISGCSHKGILDIVQWLAPDVLIGGFHYAKLPPGRQLEEAAQELGSYPTEFYTCHCTGRAAYDLMKAAMPRLHYLSCGQSLII